MDLQNMQLGAAWWCFVLVTILGHNTTCKRQMIAWFCLENALVSIDLWRALFIILF